MFQLDPRLAQDSLLLGTLPLSQVRLHIDSRYPWLMLVPVRDGITEIHHLAPEDQQQLMRESCAVASLMETALKPDSMNIGALGNVVAQLHMHHVARFTHDAAWPGPIWGAHPTLPYEETALEATAGQWQQRLQALEGFQPSPLGV